MRHDPSLVRRVPICFTNFSIVAETHGSRAHNATAECLMEMLSHLTRISHPRVPAPPDTRTFAVHKPLPRAHSAYPRMSQKKYLRELVVHRLQRVLLASPGRPFISRAPNPRCTRSLAIRLCFCGTCRRCRPAPWAASAASNRSKLCPVPSGPSLSPRSMSLKAL